MTGFTAVRNIVTISVIVVVLTHTWDHFKPCPKIVFAFTGMLPPIIVHFIDSGHTPRCLLCCPRPGATTVRDSVGFATPRAGGKGQ